MKQIDEKVKEENKEIKALSTLAKKHFVIKNQNDIVKATDYLAKIKEKLSHLDEEKKSYTAPLNKTVKKLNSTFKLLTAPLEELEKKVKDAINLFRESEEKDRLQRENQFKSSIDGTKVVIESEVPDIIEGNFGETRTVRKWTFDVIEEQKVPRKYLSIDKKKIDEDIKAGARKIKGLNIFQSFNTSFYKKN